VLSRPERAFGL